MLLWRILGDISPFAQPPAWPGRFLPKVGVGQDSIVPHTYGKIIKGFAVGAERGAHLAVN